MKLFLYVGVVVLLCDAINGLFLPELGRGRQRIPARGVSWYQRTRRVERPTHRVIDPNEDCFLMTSDEGEIFFKSPSNEPVVCGIYMIADPDQRIQVTFNYLDVPCENGGLVAWVDGWELNGQVWPADAWNDERVVETCDRRPPRKLVARQNAALVQYRVPARGKGFAITIRHLKNPRPCNVMMFGSEGIFTLRNHGATGNCSIITIAPASVRVLDLNVGQAVKTHSLLDLETGTISQVVDGSSNIRKITIEQVTFPLCQKFLSVTSHICKKRGLPDYVDIGGAGGLDHTKMEVYDSVCGLDSKEARRPLLIACEDTVVRLVSSGRFHNSVTLAFTPLAAEDIEHADLICGMDALNELPDV